MRRRWESPLGAWIAALVAWLGLVAGSAAAMEHGEARILPLPFAALVGAVGVWRPFRSAGPAAGGLASLAYVALRLLSAGGADSAGPAGLAGPLALFAPVALPVIALAGTGVLAEALARELADAERRRHQDALLIEELTPTTGTMGLLKRLHAERQIVEEVARASRYRYSVSLALASVEDWARLAEQASPEEAEAVLHGVAEVVIGYARTSDSVAHHGDGTLALLLPHTTLDGATSFLEKVRLQVRRQLGRELQAGLAEFPADAATPDELVREAEAALDFARAAGLSVASRAVFTSETG